MQTIRFFVGFFACLFGGHRFTKWSDAEPCMIQCNRCGKLETEELQPEK